MIESIYNFIDAMLDVMEEIIQIIMTILKLSLWVILFIACLPVFYLQIRREKKERGGESRFEKNAILDDILHILKGKK